MSAKELFTGKLGIQYGQFCVDVPLDEEDWEDYMDMEGAFESQENGLCGAAMDGKLFFVVGPQDGVIDLRVEMLEGPPDLEDACSDVVEVSFERADTPVILSEWGQETTHALEIPPGTYRVRYSIAEMDREYGDEDDFEAPVLGQKYLLQFWPADVAPDQILVANSEQGKYWHHSMGKGVAGYEPSTPEEGDWRPSPDDQKPLRFWAPLEEDVIAMEFERIRDLVDAIQSHNNWELVDVFLMAPSDKAPASDEVSRIGGAPVGVSESRWPTHAGKPMDHALSIDLEDIPDFKFNVPEGTRAISLFVSDLDENMAFDPGTSQTSVLCLTEDEVAQGVVHSNSASREMGPVSIRYSTQKVQAELFVGQFDSTDGLNILKQQLSSFFGFGGYVPLWLQDPESRDGYLFQFKEGLVDMHLGREGSMYVFNDSAFWQCR